MWYKFLTVVYLVLWFLALLLTIGKVPSATPVSGFAAWLLFVAVSSGVFLGYMAGKEEQE